MVSSPPVGASVLRGPAARCAALLLLGCAASRPAVPAAPFQVRMAAAEDEARRADLGMNGAVAARDAAAFGRSLAEDALFFSGAGPSSGRAAVVAAWAPYLTPGGPTLTWAPDRAEGAAAGDVVFTWGAWTWRGPEGATATGRYLTAWHREADGVLRAALDGDAAPLPTLPPGVTRAVRLAVRSADGGLLAEGGLLRSTTGTVGHFVRLSRVEAGRTTVLSDAGRLSGPGGPSEVLSVSDSAAESLHFHGVVRIDDAERGYGVPPDTTFWVASVSKSFTAALVVRLADLGKLRLGDRVLGSDLTWDELLTHTSGLPSSTYVAEGIADAAEAARLILALPRGPKGTFVYTSDGYSLLAIAAERAGGAPFFELLRREVLDRAGLRHTGFWPACLPGARVAPLARPPQGAVAGESWGYKGGEGVCSTAGDLAAFMRAVAEGRVVERPDQLFEGRVAISDGFAARGFFVSPSGTVWTRGSEDYGHNAVVRLLKGGPLIVAISDVPAVRREDVAQSRAMGDLLEARLSGP